MKMTQADYEERAARVADGTADDDDRRLVAHYEREGYSHGAQGVQVTATVEAEVVKAPRKAASRRGRGNGDGDQTK